MSLFQFNGRGQSAGEQNERKKRILAGCVSNEVRVMKNWSAQIITIITEKKERKKEWIRRGNIGKRFDVHTSWSFLIKSGRSCRPFPAYFRAWQHLIICLFPAPSSGQSFSGIFKPFRREHSSASAHLKTDFKLSLPRAPRRCGSYLPVKRTGFRSTEVCCCPLSNHFRIKDVARAMPQMLNYSYLCS